MLRNGCPVVEISDDQHVGTYVRQSSNKQVLVHWAKGCTTWHRRSQIREAAPLHAFQYTYEGQGLGGVLVIIAATNKDADALAASYEKTAGLRGMARDTMATPRPLHIDTRAAHVVYDWDGDY